MKPIPLMPLAGMNLVAEDEAMQRGGDAPRLFVRDALNIDVSPAGRALLRASPRQVSATPLRHLWQSPLHGDTFATLGAAWVRVNTADWSTAELATLGEGPVSHEVLNNLVCVAGPAGIFTFDGARALRLTLERPAAPLVVAAQGSLPAGTYGAAVAWLRGGLESAPSTISFVELAEQGGLQVSLPMCLDPSVTGARLYLTRQNGGELQRAGDHPVGSPPIALPLLPALGGASQFLHKSPMPTGRYLKLWRGRLLTARGNVLRFSEALAYHLHDERHGFVLMPQNITFVQPVDGGIWVGQVDHVAFLSGAQPDELVVQRRSTRAPVPGSAIEVKSEFVGGEASQGGSASALWLAENGYVLGSSGGAVSELHAGVMKGITASSGTSVVLDRRVLTAVL